MNRSAAFELFGPMRHSTPEEQQLFRNSINKYLIPLSLGRSIFDMDIETGYCDICHKQTQVQRKYYYYNINCNCCGGQHHFEIVRYCENCEPKPPKYISAIVTPIRKEHRINPENWDYYD